MTMLLTLILALITLFIGYPVISFYSGTNPILDSTVTFNATGQLASLRCEASNFCPAR